MKKRYLLFLLILFFCIFTQVNASVETCNRQDLDNLGVTKFKVTNSNKEYVLKTPCVNASERLYDFAEILNDDAENALLTKINEFEKKTGFDFVIVTASFPYNLDEINEDYASDFYDFNDFSKNGVIFLRNANPSDPYYGVYYFGEAQLYYEPDTDRFLDNIYNYIRNGSYVEGIDYLIDMMITDYENGDKLNNYYIDEDGYLVKKFNIVGSIFISGISALIVTIVYISSLVRRNKMILVATKATSYVDRDNIRYTVNKNNFINTVTTSHYIGSTSSGSSGGGHHSSGGHSGGGHSGGGRHG